jgi:hypothetical protein
LDTTRPDFDFLLNFAELFESERNLAGSIPAVTPRYCTKENRKCSSEHQKKKKKKKLGGFSDGDDCESVQIVDQQFFRSP